MIVAIHQPNYAPWLGYFYKMVQSDVFVFLDDAQYSRGSYTNRVRIGRAGNAVWLTQPIMREFGGEISGTRFSDDDWSRKHLDTLKGAYQGAAAFRETWPMVQAIWQQVPRESLAAANRHIVEALAASMDLRPQFLNASTLPTNGATGDERLSRIMRAVAPDGGIYLSGEGGSGYQSPDTFSSAGYELRYAGFQHPEYSQGNAPFVAGLSVLDALFNVGMDATRRLIGAR